MIVVRNFVVAVLTAATGAVLAGGLFGFLIPAPPQKNTFPPVVTVNPPDSIGFAAGITGTGTVNPNLNPLPGNFATTAADQWALLIDQERAAAGAPRLAWDPALAQVAANLLADLIANNPTTPSPLNSKNQTPIQQVTEQIPTSNATFASALVGLFEVTSNDTILVQIVNTALILGNTIGAEIALSKGWTHYGIAVRVVAGIPGQTFTRTYWAVFFAKYG